jgi:Predicted acyl-CoA transferases/carnitine dehydratase
LKNIFQTKTRDEWCNLMEGTDVCFSPVLSINEAPKHQHNIDRETFVEIDGVVQPNVAPRFSRTESKINGPSAINGEHNETALMEWGISEEKVKSIF